MEATWKQEGCDAAMHLIRTGYYAGGNPYPAGTTAAKAWGAGYREAQESTGVDAGRKRHEISDKLTFTTPSGMELTGEVQGRDWCFERLVSYTVRIKSGLRYVVDAKTLRSGHSF